MCVTMRPISRKIWCSWKRATAKTFRVAMCCIIPGSVRRNAPPAINIGRHSPAASPGKRIPWPILPAGMSAKFVDAWRAPDSPLPQNRPAPIGTIFRRITRNRFERGSSRSGDGQTIDAQGWRVDTGLEFEIVGGGEMAIHVLEIAGDGDLADGKGELAVLDPESRGAAAIVAGDAVDAHAHELGDIEAACNIADELALGDRAR